MAVLSRQRFATLRAIAVQDQQFGESWMWPGLGRPSPARGALTKTKNERLRIYTCSCPGSTKKLQQKKAPRFLLGPTCFFSIAFPGASQQVDADKRVVNKKKPMSKVLWI
jgi:hypothetical protein